MTLNQFISKYSGQTKGYPTDNDYLGECLSIVKLYIKEVFGISPPPSGSNSAYGYWTNFPNPLGQVFEKVANTPSGIPQKGDIIIWGTGAGNYGHIAIFIDGTTGSFRSFDQNWGGKQAHIQGHYYTNVVGWLHPKGGNMGKVIWDNGVEVIFTKGQVEEMASAFKLDHTYTGNESWGFVQACEESVINKISQLTTEKNNLIKGSQDKVTEIELLKKKNEATMAEYDKKITENKELLEDIKELEGQLATCEAKPSENATCSLWEAIKQLFNRKD